MGILEKTKVISAKTIRVFGIILVIIACIIAIPVFAVCLIGLCFMYPGLRMWQFASDYLDEADKEEPIEVEIGCDCTHPRSAKCAK
jgi:hypothetical protein